MVLALGSFGWFWAQTHRPTPVPQAPRLKLELEPPEPVRVDVGGDT
jgi:hypothetical protein